MKQIRLGLIGDNIARSRAPVLHRLAGTLCGLDVAYERLVPRELGQHFDAVFAGCAPSGIRGVNVTYPYKERAVARVTIEDPLVRAIAAVNTVIFEADAPLGYNTDYSGFVTAYRHALGKTPPGVVCLVGAGGVGKAVAFGLMDLGLEALRLVERDLEKAELLAAALRAARPGLEVTVTSKVASGADGAAGLINCTPVGMVGYDGTPVPRDLMASARWAFDAVYTPVDTEFLRDAEAEGLKIMSGYELFFYQGVNAFELFCGRHVDETALRRALLETVE